jgi:hypothetical protein
MPNVTKNSNATVSNVTTPSVTTKADVLNREFLEVRAKILELAAALDRLDRAAGELGDDPRMSRIARGLAALNVRQSVAQGQTSGQQTITPKIASENTSRAAEVQTIFSLAYDPTWRSTLGVDSGR